MLTFWKEMWPILGTMLVTLALITLYPELTTWLPDLLMPVK
jgi:TRAP-type C4-dicarboxylate transport system permease large subunit